MDLNVLSIDLHLLLPNLSNCHCQRPVTDLMSSIVGSEASCRTLPLPMLDVLLVLFVQDTQAEEHVLRVQNVVAFSRKSGDLICMSWAWSR
jgi:hypothetical protein